MVLDIYPEFGNKNTTAQKVWGQASMRILIITQKVDINDGVLGFFHRWVEEFAKHCESIILICLYEGAHNFPQNVRVLSLGKEEGESRSKYIFKFYQYIWQERKNYDTVFVHMNQLYVVLGGIIWRSLHKGIALWYTHKSVTTSLRIAERFADIIFTASPESFRLPSRKLHVMGHGIDTARFADLALRRGVGSLFRILTIGRISPVKDYETLIRAAEILHKEGLVFSLTIVGGIADDRHEAYLMQIRKMITEKGLDALVTLAGEVPNSQIETYLLNADAFVNMSQTGSLDKAGLEAMAAGIPTITSNEAIAGVLGEKHKNLVFVPQNPQNLAEVLKTVMNSSVQARNEIGGSLQSIVRENHDISKLIPNIIKELERA